MNTTGDPDYTYDEFADQDVPVICNKCGHNSWRETNDGDSFCVPCHYALPISKNKAIELNNLLNRK